MSIQKKTPRVRKTDQAMYKFSGRDAAWAFMRACDAAGLMAGFPEGTCVVVNIHTAAEREMVDGFAAGAPVVRYDFAGSVVS